MKGIQILQADVTELLTEAINQPYFKEEIENIVEMLWPDDVFDEDGAFMNFQFSYPERSDTYILIDVQVEINAKAVTIGDGYRSQTTYENYIASIDIDDVQLYIEHYEEIPSTWDPRIIEKELQKYEDRN